MTAANLFAKKNAGYLLADTGHYHFDGTIMALRSKIVALDSLRIAISIAGVGALEHNEMITGWFATSPDQAEALESLPRLTAAYSDEIENAGFDKCGPYMPTVQFYIATYDFKADSGACFIIGNQHHTFGTGYAPFTVRRLSALFMPPLLADRWPGLSFNPEIDALELAGLQRLTPDSDGVFRVGGEFERARVTQDGIDIQTVMAWPDKIGEIIAPSMVDGLK